MNARDRHKLLYGPYRAPRLQRGDRAFCLARDCDVVITSWTDARISWPRCRSVDATAGGGWGLLVNEELARAVRRESAAAVMHWWGVSVHTVWGWRKALGVTRTNNPGSQWLIHAAAEQGARAVQAKEWTEAERERKRQLAIETKRIECTRGKHPAAWKPEEVALLGNLPDAEVARRTGRPLHSVRSKRERLGLPNPGARKGDYGVPDWSAAEDRLVRTLSPRKAARRTGRTMHAIYGRRHHLGVTGRGQR